MIKQETFLKCKIVKRFERQLMILLNKTKFGFAATISNEHLYINSRQLKYKNTTNDENDEAAASVLQPLPANPDK